MSYTQLEEDERKVPIYNRRVERLAYVILVFASSAFHYAWGQDTQFDLATRSYNNAEVATRMLWVCTESAARTMSLVFAEDRYLHQKIRELPPVVWKVQP